MDIIEILKQGVPKKQSKDFEKVVLAFKKAFPKSSIASCAWCNRHQIYRSLIIYYGI